MSPTPPKRRRKLVLFAWVLSCLVGLAALVSATASGAGAAGRTPDSKLLRMYEPVLVLHPSELFRPTKVQSFVEDSELERFVGSSPMRSLLEQIPVKLVEHGQLGVIGAASWYVDNHARG
jgi:hypothetical protein